MASATLFYWSIDMGVRVSGLDEVLANIEGLRTEMGTAAIKSGARAAAKVYAEAERESAPILDHKTAGSSSLEPGELKGDIRVTPATQDDDGFVHVYVGPGKKTHHVAGWVEWGHRLVRGGYSRVLASGKTRGPGKEVGRVLPHPFLRPAYEKSQEEALNAFVAAAAKRLGRWLR